MFRLAFAFNQNIGSWNTGNVTTLYNMFYTDVAFNGNISGWNTGKVANMAGTFLSASGFSGDISGWDTSNVTTMNYMFYAAIAFNGNISGWNTGKVANMAGMFYSASGFNQNLSSWNVSSLTTATDMFKSIALSTANYDALLNGWSSRPVKNDTVFGGGDSKYSVCGGGNASRYNLSNNYNWAITDGGFDSAYACPDTAPPTIDIVYPLNITYNVNVSELNYTASDANLQACWYSLNGGANNVSITCGDNITGLTSNQGSNTWKIWANDSIGYVNSSSVTFLKDTIYPQFSNYWDNSFTLIGVFAKSFLYDAHGGRTT
jgi:surface protein